jgi:hypothetical protein
MFPSDVEANRSERPWLCSSNVLTISFAAPIIGVFSRSWDVDSKQAEPLIVVMSLTNKTGSIGPNANRTTNIFSYSISESSQLRCVSRIIVGDLVFIVKKYYGLEEIFDY